MIKSTKLNLALIYLILSIGINAPAPTKNILLSRQATPSQELLKEEDNPDPTDEEELDFENEEYYHNYYNEDADGKKYVNPKEKHRKIRTRYAWTLFKLQQAVDFEDRDLITNDSQLHDIFERKNGQQYRSDRYSFFLIKPKIVSMTPRQGETTRYFIPTERNVYIHEQESIMVPCFPATEELEEVTWIIFRWHNAEDDIMDYDELLAKRISLTNHQELWIRNAELGDSGVYVCRVEATKEGYSEKIISLNHIHVHVYQMAMMSLVQKIGLSLSACNEAEKKNVDTRLHGHMCPDPNACNFKVLSKCLTKENNTKLEVSIYLFPSPTFKYIRCSDPCFFSYLGLHLSKKRANISRAISLLSNITNADEFNVNEKFTFYCLPGYFLYRFSCVPCFRGSYLQHGGPQKRCERCPQGYYQNNIASLNCLQCGSSTGTMGNFSHQYIKCNDIDRATSASSVFMGLGIFIALTTLISFFVYNMIICYKRIKRKGLLALIKKRRNEKVFIRYDDPNLFRPRVMVLGREISGSELTVHDIEKKTKMFKEATLPFQEMLECEDSGNSSIYLFDVNNNNSQRSSTYKKSTSNRSGNARKTTSEMEPLLDLENSYSSDASESCIKNLIVNNNRVLASLGRSQDEFNRALSNLNRALKNIGKSYKQSGRFKKTSNDQIRLWMGKMSVEELFLEVLMMVKAPKLDHNYDLLSGALLKKYNEKFKKFQMHNSFVRHPISLR